MVVHPPPTNKQPQHSDHDKARFYTAGLGMTAAEFESATSRAFVEHMASLPNNVPADTIAELITRIKTELIKRSEVLELMPTGTMADIGGLDALKDWVRERKDAFTEEAREMGVDKPKGAALIGPPDRASV